MFNNISWQGYWITVALFTTGYYLVIYLLYFGKDFSVTIRGKNPMSREESPISPFTADSITAQFHTIEQPARFDNPEEFQPPATGTIESVVYGCMDEVSAYLEEAKRNKCVKEEVLYALRSILRKYPAIAASEYEGSVTTVLVNQCEYHCSVHLSADDVAQVWLEG